MIASEVSEGGPPPRHARGATIGIVEDLDVSLRGKLLVASPALVDPNFARTVVLITEHSEEGAMGVVLNRPSETEVGEVAPELAPVAGDEPVFIGGPVQPQALVVLAEFTQPDAAAWIIAADVGFVAAQTEGERLESAVRRGRVYAGYSGWGAGQLEAELAGDGWIVEPPLPAELFPDDPETLWHDVLERKGGQFALIARMPDDPSLN
jgi:putative transcriptional regulator